MQKALFVTAIGKPVVLSTRLIPKPAAGEVLIKVTATMLLPHDTYGRDLGLFIAENLPFVLGTNIVGIVEKLGPGETKYKIDDHIFGQGNPFGPTSDSTGLQEHAILIAQCSSLVPEGFSDDQAVAVPVNALSSFAALFHPDYLVFPAPHSVESKGFDYGSQSLVIVGGGSNAGKFGVQWAKIAGFGKVVVIASLAHDADLKAMGATDVINRHSTTIVEDVHKIIGEDSVTHIYDCVSWTYELAVGLVSNTLPSRLMSLHDPASAGALLEAAGKKQVTVGYVSGARKNLMSIADTFWPFIAGYMKEGKILIPKFRLIEGFNEVAINEALDSYRDGSTVTQAIVHP